MDPFTISMCYGQHPAAGHLEPCMAPQKEKFSAKHEAITACEMGTATQLTTWDLQHSPYAHPLSWFTKSVGRLLGTSKIWVLKGPSPCERMPEAEVTGL